MKITHIRIRKLVSRPTGYGHDAIELEAQIEEGEDWEGAASALRREVDAQIQSSQGRHELRELTYDLQEQVHSLEGTRDRLKAEIDENRKIIRKHEKLVDLAQANNIDAGALADNMMPF